MGLIFLLRDLNALPFVLILTKALLWLLVTLLAVLLWSHRSCGRRVLRTVELVIFWGVACYLAWEGIVLIRGQLAGGSPALAVSGIMESLLQSFLLIVTYGILVPNSWQRASLVVFPMVVLPVGVGTALHLSQPEMARLVAEPGTARQILDALLLFLMGVAIAICAVFVMGRYRSFLFENRQLGLYQLQSKIGAGGMGEVWLAQHRMLARPAALKLIRPDRLENGDGSQARQAIQRFEREARFTASLRSPNTVELYDFGVTREGVFFYVMEYLEGLDLESLVDRFGPLPSGRVVFLLRQICQSLGEAHTHGMIHRDVKPGNIYLCRMGLNYDVIKVLDFGLVKSARNGHAETRITTEGSTTGTPAFMAPELAVSPEQVDGRADLYALGAVAYWLLTGQLVFEQNNPMAMMVDHVKTTPTPPSERTELPISQELDQIILRCLEKDPARRFQTAQELESALARCSDASWDPKQSEQWWGLNLPPSPGSPIAAIPA